MTRRSVVATALVAMLLATCAAPTPPQPTQVDGSPTPGGSPGPSAVTPAPTDGSAPPTPAGTQIQATPACDLLYKDEVAAALGIEIELAEPFETNVDNGAGWLGECTFKTHNYDEFAPFTLTLTIGDQYVADFQALSATGAVTPLSGLGDEAQLRVDNIWGVDGPLAVLYVRLGNGVLGLTMGVASIADDGAMVLVGNAERQQDILQELAAVAVGRLANPVEPAARTCDLMTVAEASGLVGLPLARSADVDTHDEWGPACHYSHGSGVVELYVGVDSRDTASAHFDACATSAEPVAGIGDAAYYNHFCQVPAGSRFMTASLFVRAGGKLIIVGEGSLLSPDAARAVMADVARFLLTRIAYTPGESTPPPITAPPPSAGTDAQAAFANPCALLSDDDVWTAVGAPITSHQELGAGPEDDQASCYYRNDDASTQPLELTLNRGQGYLAQFELWRTGGGFEPVEGVGDAAISDQYEELADQPLVNLYLRVGDVIVTMRMGGIDRSADGTEVAAGSPEQQLFVLTELAQMVIDRLLYPPPG